MDCSHKRHPSFSGVPLSFNCCNLHHCNSSYPQIHKKQLEIELTLQNFTRVNHSLWGVGGVVVGWLGRGGWVQIESQYMIEIYQFWKRNILSVCQSGYEGFENNIRVSHLMGCASIFQTIHESNTTCSYLSCCTRLYSCISLLHILL